MTTKEELIGHVGGMIKINDPVCFKMNPLTTPQLEDPVCLFVGLSNEPRVIRNYNGKENAMYLNYDAWQAIHNDQIDLLDKSNKEDYDSKMVIARVLLDGRLLKVEIYLPRVELLS